VVRVLHGLSFVDDPTRVLRGARFESRYGFAMDESTERLARQAAEMGMLAEVSGARVREELLDILAEKTPATVFARLDGLGALATLLPEGAAASAVPSAVEEAQRALDVLASAFSTPGPKRGGTLFAALAATSDRRAVTKWLRHLHVSKVLGVHSEELAERGPSILKVLGSPKGLRDSRLFRALHPLAAETIVVLWARADELGRERIERFLGQLAGVRLAVGGADLIAMGADPSDAFSAILARALDDRLDGRAVGRDDELANLRRLAIRAGLVGHRKDPA
jgi:tRNA nucleotidyltransferase (CCA-adding enzyme)